MIYPNIGLSGLLALLLVANLSAQKPNPRVNLALSNNPEDLNPLSSVSAEAVNIQSLIFMSLADYDPKTLQLSPQLAKSNPKVALIDTGYYKGGMSLSYEIKPEAVWDNGSPVTGYDFSFTVKAIKNPRVKSAPIRPYVEFIQAVEIDPSNSKKFTIYSKERYFLAESSASTLLILPEYVYDSAQIMRKFNPEDLDTIRRIADHNQVIKFANQFNRRDFSNQILVGCGAYRLSEWKEKESLCLVRKPNHWSNPSRNHGYPDTLFYRIYPYTEDALAAAQAGELDVMTGVRPEVFIELKEQKELRQRFNFEQPTQFSYTYIGINCKKPALADKKTRQALAHLVNRDWIVKKLYQNMAVKINSPISQLKPYYNKQLISKELNVEKAKKMLQEAGWADSDSNAVLDKIIDGQKVEMRLSFKYNNGNPIRKNIALMMQAEAAKAGIVIEIEAVEWSGYLKQLQAREFDLCCLAWVQSSGLDDMNQIWHSRSDSPDGSNRVGFNHPEADLLIDELRNCIDASRQQQIYLRLQAIIAEEQPYIFLCSPRERILISKKFKNTQVSSLRPNYNPQRFQRK